MTGWGRSLGLVIMLNFVAELQLLVGHQEEDKGEEDGQCSDQEDDIGRGGGGRCVATVSVRCFLNQRCYGSNKSINKLRTLTCATGAA